MGRMRKKIKQLEEEFGQEDCSNYRTVTSIINMNIYKAINEKIKELRWLNE